MAKSASPIRLQAELMQVAESTAKRFHRSTAEQIEYWADLGREVSAELDPDILLSIKSGLTVIKTEPVFSDPVDPDRVFQSLEEKRDTGVLSGEVTNSAVCYQASTEHPGYLEKIDACNNITTGQFKNGQFIERKQSDS
jgi:hypothetical protein